MLSWVLSSIGALILFAVPLAYATQVESLVWITLAILLYWMLFHTLGGNTAYGIGIGWFTISGILIGQLILAIFGVGRAISENTSVLEAFIASTTLGVGGAFGINILRPTPWRPYLLLVPVVAVIHGITLAHILGIALIAVTSGGLVLGALAGRLIAAQLRPGVLLYQKAWPYLRATIVPTVGFFAGHVVIVAWFAPAYASIHCLNPQEAFINTTVNTQFSEFLYFSIMTISTLGYSEIRPKAPVAQFLASFEAAVGIGWSLAVFAAFIAYLEPRFARIRKTMT